MKFTIYVPLIAVLLLTLSCTSEKYKTLEAVDSNGYKYQYVTNDPQNVRIYTLNNGLKIYLSVNKDAPRIKTQISVRAGSTYDPAETTGLAHYFEHLMFKGTQHFGTKDWEAEKPLLDEIEELFELHRTETDPVKKKELYHKIDSVSYIASQYAIPNEYDKLVSSMGATGTNAGTSWEYTVYINEIPSNELEKWVEMERERFDSPVLRLFHTELETVYEEFNRYQDMDGQRQFFEMFKGLFPNHPLSIDRIGYPKDLKNPSIKNIYEFYNTWYVPNNMSFQLSGDLDYEETVKTIDKLWGNMKAKELPKLNLPQVPPLTDVVESHITGPDAESVIFAYRFGGEKSQDKLYVSLIDYILANSVAGLIDINLNQKQEILYGVCSPLFLTDYGIHYFYGQPKQDQTLEQVRDLLIAQIDSIKEGKFEDWMLTAAINDMRLQSIKRNEGNGRINQLNDAFIFQEDYAKILSFYDDMAKLTKADLMAFAKQHYKNNYAIVYKHTGDAEGIVKMDKPDITPVVINREDQSEFLQAFLQEKAKPIEPVFVDFDKEITTEKINESVELKYIPNTTNELFELDFIVEIGKNNDLMLPLAVNYLPFLGTDKYSAEELQKEFFKLGISMNVSSGSDRSYLTISGLQANMDKGLALFEHLLSNVQPDTLAYQKFVANSLKSRRDAKLNPDAIRSALIGYGIYGDKAPNKLFVPEDELLALDPSVLTEKIKQFTAFPHRFFNYGNETTEAVKALLTKYHPTPEAYLTIPEEVKFEQLPTDNKDILFVNYDKSQVDVIMLSKSVPYNREVAIQSSLFNEYYGYGMNSVVWQEIREARALAYTAYANFAKPSKKENSFYLQAIVFTQSDKLLQAESTMRDLLQTMVYNEKSFDLARQNIIKTIQTQRIIKKGLFWTWLANQEFDINYDQRKDTYDFAQKASIEDVDQFFKNYIQNSEFTYVISGNKANLDMKGISKQGNLKELSLEDIFGY